jgi:hypothetical protein
VVPQITDGVGSFGDNKLAPSVSKGLRLLCAVEDCDIVARGVAWFRSLLGIDRDLRVARVLIDLEPLAIRQQRGCKFGRNRTDACQSPGAKRIEAG